MKKLPLTLEYKELLYGRGSTRQCFLRAEVSEAALIDVTVTQRPVCNPGKHQQGRAAGLGVSGTGSAHRQDGSRAAVSLKAAAEEEAVQKLTTQAAL